MRPLEVYVGRQTDLIVVPVVRREGSTLSQIGSKLTLFRIIGTPIVDWFTAG
jgi:hypothetical protein